MTNEDGTSIGNAYAAYTVRILVPVNALDDVYSGQAFVREQNDNKIALGVVEEFSVKSLANEYLSRFTLSDSIVNALNALIK